MRRFESSYLFTIVMYTIVILAILSDSFYSEVRTSDIVLAFAFGINLFLLQRLVKEYDDFEMLTKDILMDLDAKVQDKKGDKNGQV